MNYALYFAVVNLATDKRNDFIFVQSFFIVAWSAKRTEIDYECPGPNASSTFQHGTITLSH